MFLYEIKAARLSKLLEQTTADIDRDLTQTASQIKNAQTMGGGADLGGAASMGDPTFGAAPDPMAGESPLQAQDPGIDPDDPLGGGATDEEQDELLMQKVDQILISATKGHPYSRGYQHQDSSKIHPYKILGMNMDELNQLRTMARNKANIETFNGELGVYDNPDIKFFQDLVSFVDKVIEVKKSSTKEYSDTKHGKTAKHETRGNSKIKAGKVKK